MRITEQWMAAARVWRRGSLVAESEFGENVVVACARFAGAWRGVDGSFAAFSRTTTDFAPSSRFCRDEGVFHCVRGEKPRDFETQEVAA